MVVWEQLNNLHADFSNSNKNVKDAMSSSNFSIIQEHFFQCIADAMSKSCKKLIKLIGRFIERAEMLFTHN